VATDYFLGGVKMRLNTLAKRMEVRRIYLNGFEVTEYKELNAVIGVKNTPAIEAIAFAGTAGRPTWHYVFSTAARREKCINDWLEGLKRHKEYKEKAKQENKGHLTGAAACAAAIRAELKAKFPGIKFYVRSESFSGGDSVDVDWTDGPDLEEVETIVSSYQAGHFDGMEDMYIYDDKEPGKPTAKFVFANKSWSEAKTAELKAKAEELGILHKCTNNFNEFRPVLAEKYIKEAQRAEATEEVKTEEPTEEPQQQESETKIINLNDRPATKKQLWALHLITGLNTKEWGLTLQQASILINLSKQGLDIVEEIKKALQDIK
jgi:hypothetical protein